MTDEDFESLRIPKRVANTIREVVGCRPLASRPASQAEPPTTDAETYR